MDLVAWDPSGRMDAQPKVALPNQVFGQLEVKGSARIGSGNIFTHDDIERV